VKKETPKSVGARALELLSSPNFFPELLDAIQKDGVVGEERNALVIYIAATSRLFDKPLCLFVKGASSVGKNFLTDAVLKLFPESDMHLMTSSSLRSWNYMPDLAHKIIYLKERNESAGPVHPLRLLISDRELVHYVPVKKHGKWALERRVTKGPVASISTTTQDRVEVDDENRNLSIWLDDSPEQTRKIMEAAVETHSGLQANERDCWYAVQQLIEKRASVPIELPQWFKNLASYARNDNLKARRYFPAFLQACKTVALIRSFRPAAKITNKSPKIIVRFTDFAITALVFNAVFEHSIDTADDEDFEIQKCVRRMSSGKGGAVSATELAAEMEISDDRAYSLLRKAARAGTIVRANQPSKSNLKLYLPTKRRPFLPDPTEVFQNLDGLPDHVKFVRPLTGEWVTYRRK
jgi:hypothetical protein